MKEKILTNSIIYTVCGLLLKCFSLFLLPLYTSLLSAEDYGITSIAQVFSTTMGFIVAFSLYSAVLRFYVDLKENEEQLKRFYGTIIIFTIVSSIMFGLIICLIRQLVSKYIFSGVPFFPTILICVVSLVFSCQHSIYENILRSQQKAIKYAITVILFFFTTFSFNMLFVVHMRLGALGVLLSTMLGNIFYTAFFWIDMVRNKSVKFCFDIHLLKSALKYSIPIMPHNLSTMISTFFSRVFIGNIGSLSVLGLYSVAQQFGGMADTVQGYVSSAYGPWLYETLYEKREDYKQRIRTVVNLLSWVLGLFFICIAFFSQDFIFLFINEGYFNAWKYIPFIVLAYVIKMIYHFYIDILLYYKEASRYLFVATLSGSIVSMFLIYILVPHMGAYGSILADGVSILIRSVIIVSISKKYESIGTKLTDLIKKIFVIALFIFIGLLPSLFAFFDKFNIYNFLYKIVIVLIYCVLALYKYKGDILGFIKGLFKKLPKETKSC